MKRCQQSQPRRAGFVIPHLLVARLLPEPNARRWGSARLAVGDESRVTQAIRRVKSGVEPGLERLKEQLERAYEGGTRAGT